MDFVEYYSVQISKKMKNKTNKYEPMTAKNITSRIQDIHSPQSDMPQQPGCLYMPESDLLTPIQGLRPSFQTHEDLFQGGNQ